MGKASDYQVRFVHTIYFSKTWVDVSSSMYRLDLLFYVDSNRASLFKHLPYLDSLTVIEYERRNKDEPFLDYLEKGAAGQWDSTLP